MAENTTTRTRRDWCLWCREVYDVNAGETCPMVPDGGEHEGWPSGDHPSAEAEVRQGSSLHSPNCPRSNTSPRLPDFVPCMCNQP